MRWYVLMLVSIMATGCECDAARVPEGAVSVCAIERGTSQGCNDPMPVLGEETCRCGSRYYWDGAGCSATAACYCYEGCDRLFDSALDCRAAYASCRADGGP